jgi:carboxylate-amine ligase
MSAAANGQFAFQSSAALSLGTELELQLLDRRTGDLTRAASDLLALVKRAGHPGQVKPEITESMIEIATSVHTGYGPLMAELLDIRDAVAASADRLNISVSGGGVHPFQRWSERKIFDRPRFRHLSELYGYLAKQFTVFGQHVHIGVTSGDDALYLVHALARYVPHFIALAAASPFYQGVDTAFDSSRLNAISAFPLSGRAPWLLRWSDFASYLERMKRAGIAASMKDFYWDIRPKPEFGTVEVRVCDTPLTMARAAALAAYVQMLACRLLKSRDVPLDEESYLAYSFNRFQACRFGLDGDLIDPVSGTRRSIADDLLETLDALSGDAAQLGAERAWNDLREIISRSGNDARWMRDIYAQHQSLAELVWRQAERWRRGALI